ncbi:MAG: hypothetical protein ACHQF2_07330, partial [Flavobacteriales bacterium]
LKDTIDKDVNDPLLRLIQSLTKAEKKYFKILNRQSSGKLKFIKLFDAIERSDSFNEEKLKSLKGITPGQLPNLKMHLYQKILQSVRHLRATKLPESIVNDLIEDARVLYEKCLYAECLRTLTKAREMAIKHRMQIQLLGIYELEKRAVGLVSPNTSGGSRVQEIINEINNNLYHIDNANTFSNLLLTINDLYRKYGFIRNRSELADVKVHFQQSLPSYDEKQLGFEEKMYLYYAFTAYNFFIRNTREGYNYANKLVNLFEDSPEMKYSKTEFYIKALNQLLVAQNKLYMTDDFMRTHRKLVSLKRDKKIKLSRNLNLHLFKAIYIHEINKHFMLGEFGKGTRVVNKHLHELNKFFPLLDKNTIYLFYYKIACLYLGAGQHKQALSWLNRIVRDGGSAIREDLQSFARILRLICYFELNDDDGVQSNIKSTYRFLLSRKNFNKYEQQIMRFLKTLKGNETAAELRKRFIVLKDQMMRISRSHYEKRSFIYFDMISWLESKIQNKPIQAVFQERMGLQEKKKV